MKRENESCGWGRGAGGVGGTSVLGRGNSKIKGLEAGLHLTCSRHSQVSGLLPAQQRLPGGGKRESAPVLLLRGLMRTPGMTLGDLFPSPRLTATHECLRTGRVGARICIRADPPLRTKTNPTKQCAAGHGSAGSLNSAFGCRPEGQTDMQIKRKQLFFWLSLYSLGLWWGVPCSHPQEESPPCRGFTHTLPPLTQGPANPAIPFLASSESPAERQLEGAIISVVKAIGPHGFYRRN